jgi:lysophospholipase L1-like esterase
VADAGPDQAVADGAGVQLDGRASFDLDGSIASYAWLQLSGPPVALANANTAQPSFVAPDPGSGSAALVFQLTVTDDAGTPDTDTVQVDAWDSDSLVFSDAFLFDSTGGYTLTLIEPAEGTGTFVHDTAGHRAQIRTGNDFGLRIAHAVPPRTSGRLSLDLLPTQKWPNGGRLFVRLLQDADNYYEVSNYDGSGGPGTLRKVVGGVVVASSSFAAGYVQNTPYHVSFDFSPGATDVRAYGQSLAIGGNATPLTIRSIEIETYQQTAYVDNIAYGDEVNAPPVADAGADLAAAAGELLQLDGSGSSDPDGLIASYQWLQLSGPAVTLSNPAAQKPTFTVPDPGSGHVPLSFRLTVTDDAGAPAQDTVAVEAWSPSALVYTDSFDTNTVGSFAQTPIFPENGTGTMVYDSTEQRAQIRTGNDFGVIVARSLPPRTSGRFSASMLPTRKYPSGGQIFVRLMQDAQNYYEIYNSDGYGPGALSKVVNGQVVDTTPFQSGYVQNAAYAPLVFDFSPSLATLEAFGQFLALETDTAAIRVTRLEIEAYQQDLYLDDLSYTDFVEQPPFVHLTAPGDFSFQTSTTLRASAFPFRFQPGWRVAFALDVATPDEVLIIDASAPYSVDFTDVEKGTHTVDVYVVDASGTQVIGPELQDQVVGVEIGDYYVGIGDSITRGQGDDVASDDTSLDGRDSGGGYEPVLNDELSAATGFANVVKNEGIGGRTSLGALSKMNGMLNNHPNAQFVLLLFGTNDSKNELAVPSGLGLQSGDFGYLFTYKANMQQLIDATLARGKVPVLAKIPIAYGNCGRCSAYPNPQTAPQNVRIREYNQVIDELVVENDLPIAGPDLYTHFAAHPEQMADRLHPNGVGYQAIAELWSEALFPR